MNSVRIANNSLSVFDSGLGFNRNLVRILWIRTDIGTSEIRGLFWVTATEIRFIQFGTALSKQYVFLSKKACQYLHA